MKHAAHYAIFALGLLLSVPPAAAAGYREKLAEIERVIDVSFGAFLSELERAEAVTQLHALVKGEQAGYFGRRKLVREVRIEEVRLGGLEGDEAADKLREYLRLHGHHVLFPLHADSGRLLAEALPGEEQALEDIAETEDALHDALDNLEIERGADYPYNGPNSNLSYLETLRVFAASLEQAKELGLDLEDDFAKIVLRDEAEYLGSGSFSVYDGSRGDVLTIVSARYGYPREKLIFGAAYMDAYWRLLAKGYEGLRFDSTLEEKSYPEWMAEFLGWLSDDKSAYLKRKGVKRFALDEHFDARDDLFRDGELILGPTAEDMDRIVSAIFGDAR